MHQFFGKQRLRQDQAGGWHRKYSCAEALQKMGFQNGEQYRAHSSHVAIAKVNSEQGMNEEHRDYDAEAVDNQNRRYAYDFDFDVIHPFLIRSFSPFFLPGKALELGSFKGAFTQRLAAVFDDITCVEASADAIQHAQEMASGNVGFVHSTFEQAQLPCRYDNVILTHVLEHLDEPVELIKKIRTDWLAKGGRLFVACPNANAPSRQIAVKMGLISHNAAVTAGEAEHGHRCTYSLDTLERDVNAGGLSAIHRSGVFFKALANFQWDKLLQTDIVSKEYLEGCFQIGQIYPELCSSIILVCEDNN